MFWRMKRSDFEKQSGEANRQAMQDIIDAGEVPGLLAYLAGEPAGGNPVPIGWVSIAPRPVFTALERSRLFKPIDEQPVWSIVCFFVSRKYRRQGLTVQLLRGAIDYADQHGARIVEAYPVEPKKESAPDVFVYTGLASAFRKAGFVEVARRSETRPMMRYYLAKD
jgi:GNAT superfamily N-acetyltransferase